MQKINIAILLLNIMITAFLTYRTVEQTQSHTHTLHQYDYVLEVDATDSVEIFHIFDNRHYSVGSFMSTHSDSLQIIIDQDNL